VTDFKADPLKHVYESLVGQERVLAELERDAYRAARQAAHALSNVRTLVDTIRPTVIEDSI
jgi:hypothetical protein